VAAQGRHGGVHAADGDPGRHHGDSQGERGRRDGTFRRIAFSHRLLRHAGYASELHGFWQQGSANLIDQEAITGFEADHGMTTNGVASPAVTVTP